MSTKLNPPPRGSSVQPPPSTQETTPDELPANCDIGVWGKPGAGKTALLAAMLRGLETGKADESYSVLPPRDIGTDSELFKLRQRTEEFLIRVISEQFVLGTDGGIRGNQVRANMEPMLFYTVRFDNQSKKPGLGLEGRFHKLYMMDAAGGLIDNNAPHDYWVHLRETRGILMAIDGTRTDQDYEMSIRNLEHQLGHSTRARTSSKFPHFLAICLTRADQLAPGGPGSAENFDAKSRLREILSADPYYKLTNNFPNHEVFLSSPMGWIREGRNWIPNTNGHGVVKNMSRWRPYNCVRPLLWLMDKIEEQKIKERRGFYNRGLLNKQANRQRRKNMELLEEALNKLEGDLSVYYP